jgi:hypothetical protein
MYVDGERVVPCSSCVRQAHSASGLAPSAWDADVPLADILHIETSTVFQPTCLNAKPAC